MITDEASLCDNIDAFDDFGDLREFDMDDDVLLSILSTIVKN